MAIRQKGNKWQVDVTVQGARSPRVAADTRAQAEKIEADFKARLLAGASPASLLPEAPKALAKGSLGALLDATFKARWAATKAEVSSLRNGNVWVDELGADYEVYKLGKPEGAQAVADVCDKLHVGGNAAGTINRKLAALSVMLGVAEERGMIDRRIKLPKRKEYEGRLRWYDDEEVESLINHGLAVSQTMGRLFELAVETGLRQSELLGLTKRDFDLKGGLVLLGRTKGNKRRSVPLTNKALQVAQRLCEGHLSHEKVFPDQITCRYLSRLIGMWKNTRGLPKDDEACFHTFRHTTASRLVQRKVPIVVVQKWMGHATIQTTMRYAHLAPDSLDMALEALNGE